MRSPGCGQRQGGMPELYCVQYFCVVIGSCLHVSLAFEGLLVHRRRIFLPKVIA